MSKVANEWLSDYSLAFGAITFGFLVQKMLEESGFQWDLFIVTAIAMVISGWFKASASKR